MLTTEDIEKLAEYQKTVFATRAEIATKQDMAEIKASINTLTMAVDSFSKEIKTNREERVITEERLTRVEKAVKVLVDHTGVIVQA